MTWDLAWWRKTDRIAKLRAQMQRGVKGLAEEGLIGFAWAAARGEGGAVSKFSEGQL
jgi:hypothetical protein